MTKHREGKVYLVGAGCGEAALITVRGAELLKACDAVVYDDLIDNSLMDLVSPEAIKLYMGKRRGSHSAPQEEICNTLIELASRGLCVVRLKGGDPLVFGRGGEEMLALLKAGIEAEIVPGISSCIAVPAEAGIPVTHRGVSRSFHVVTAHTGGPDGGIPEDLEKLAGVNGTIVILMGLRQIREIAARLITAGMDPGTPAAVISGKMTGHFADVRAPLGEIAERTKAAGVQAPAVIVIGETAAMDLYQGAGPEAGKISLGDPGALKNGEAPLRSMKVALTGTDSIQKKLKPALKSLGAQVYSAERSVIEPVAVPESRFDEICDGQPHWIVFTSENGVKCFFRQYLEACQSRKIPEDRENRRVPRDLRSLAACRFAVIGKATGRALMEAGFHADLCPEHYTGEKLAEALLADQSGIQDVWLFRSAIGDPETARLLSEKFSVRDVPVYRLRPEADRENYIRRQLENTDYLVFSSGSGAEYFYDLYGSIPERIRCICIGEKTAEILKARGCGNYLVSGEISAEGIIRTILQDAQEC